MWNLKYDTNELIYKTNRFTDIENKVMLTTAEKGWGWDKPGIWNYQIQTTMYKIHKQKKKIYKQQGPTVLHRKLDSISCNKP